MSHSLLAAQLVVTAMLTGIIWFVQLVHYPLLGQLGNGTAAYMQRHMTLATRVIGPLIGAETLLAAAVLGFAWQRGAELLPLVGFALVVLILMSTKYLQRPCYKTLCRGPHPQTLRRLIATNWIRTVAWSVRSLLCAAMLLNA
jgi:hypothetical protein